MTKAEALELVGKRVEGWTAANGIYGGTLQEVVAEKGRPWRGIILIDSIFAPAQHFEQGSACRRGFRVGETIEIGGINIKPTDVTGPTDYAAILDNAAKVSWEQYEAHKQYAHSAWASKCFAMSYEAAAIVERERLQTGEWSIRNLQKLYRDIREKNEER